MSEDLQFHIKCKKGDVGRYVILTGDPGRCIKIAEHFSDCEKVAQNREFITYSGYLEGEKVSVTSTGIGGPSASIAIEELAKIGADTFIRVGTAGGLNVDVLSGDVAIPTGAIRTEGTSKDYLPVEFPAVPNLQVINALVRSAENLGYGYHTGIVRCKDAFYGERDPEIRPMCSKPVDNTNMWMAAGAIASEMESAVLYIVGSLLKVRVGTVLLVGTNHVRRKLGIDDIRVNDPKKAIDVGVEAMRIVL